jgi:hypothetical protein
MNLALVEMRPSSIPAPLSGSPPVQLPLSRLRNSMIPERIGARYRVRALLGRGGMAAVYRVSDGQGGGELALKQLQLPGNADNQATIETLFKQEYCTLAQLQHPRVIRVYEYGRDQAGSYYTMELLDGGSLSECAPLPWREACALIHDVCSSLSLLHVRRLVHRDVSPHNVRRTLDGRAKLIDFGAMAAMGPSEQVIGTPAFSAPEVARRLVLDARTDLYSLGATLYFALTGQLAFPARNFAQLVELWANQPAPPSAFVPEIPPQLDSLVMSMLSLEPALRPRSASEVMLQLATLIGQSDAEHADVSRAYLSAPSLVGRDELLRKFERRAARAHTRAGSGLVIQGSTGMGRTRALEACVLLAQTNGATVTRVAASVAGAQPFAAAQQLTEQLARALPELCAVVADEAQIAESLFEPADAPAAGALEARALRMRSLSHGRLKRSELRDALTKLWLSIARQRVVLIAVDDIERLDEPSAAWLATLAAQLKQHRLLLVCTATPAARENCPALAVIAEHCARYDLPALDAGQVETLLLSAFGDVPHAALLSDRVFRVARGNPRACMDLARYLIDRGTIRYEGGTWIMPTQLALSDLPATMDEAFAARIAALSTRARSLAELLALSVYGALSNQDCRQLAGTADGELDQAIHELSEQGAVACRRDAYEIFDEIWASTLARALDDTDRRERHRLLGTFGLVAQREPVAIAYHLFSAGLEAQAFDALAALMTKDPGWGVAGLSENTLPRDTICKVLRWDLTYAERAGRAPREIADIRRWLCTLSLGSEDEYYRCAAPGLLATLKRDSGLDDWGELAHVADAGQRLSTALQRAIERHLATPEAERAYGVQDAIKYLVQYVAASIPIGTRTLDAVILSGLPGLLEPFAVLSPVIAAMHQNALATRECMVLGRYAQARARWQEIYDRLGTVPRDDLHYVDLIRSAILYALGSLEAARGQQSAAARAELLDNEPMQMVNAMYLRRVLRLQLGDFEGAEHFRRKAELLAVQDNSRQMFTTFILVELLAYGTARDLTAIREISARMAALAKTSPSWLTYQLIAEGCLKLLRGDPQAALAPLEAALVRCWPDSNEPMRSISAMPMASAMYLEVLIALEAYEQAKAFGLRALAEAARAEISSVDEVERGLALAEAKLGDPVGAATRLDAVIARQLAQGVSGLQLGTQYEARARVAIWAGDQAAMHEYGKLAALQYGHGRGSPLGARYERLINDARHAGVRVTTELSEFETNTLGSARLGSRASARRLLSVAVRAASTAEERASAVVSMFSEVAGARATHLFFIRADGTVSWAASHGEQPHGDTELILARQSLERALNDDFGSTQVESELSNTDFTSSMLWNDASGVPHRVQLLTASPDREPRYVAVIIATAPSQPLQNPSLLNAMAEYFVTSGDSEGLAV